MGALAASSAFGNFVQDWSKHYQTSQDPAKEARATAVLKQGFKVPQDAMKSIKVASYIFDGDDGHSAKELTEYLQKTGAVESAYGTKVQGGGYLYNKLKQTNDTTIVRREFFDYTNVKEIEKRFRS